MISARLVCAALLLVPVTSTAFAASLTPSDQDKLQAACYADVERLCKDDIPDEDKVTACMTTKKAQVSTQCKEAYKAIHR